MSFPRILLVFPALLLLPATFAADSVPAAVPGSHIPDRPALSFVQGHASTTPMATLLPSLLESRSDVGLLSSATTSTLAPVGGSDAEHPDPAAPAARALNAPASRVPEPSTLALAALSAVLLFIVRRRPTLGG
jgi:hypothetical protein